jgi:hypothetical protein
VNRQEVRIVTAHQRQRFGLILGNGLAPLARIRLKLQSHIGDLHGGLRLPNLQFQIDALAAAYRNRDVLRNGLGVIGRFG